MNTNAFALRAPDKLDQALWNGEYYVQKISDKDLNAYKYQYGKGCLADQVLGQFMAFVCGLGYVVSEEHVHKCLQSIFHYNFRDILAEHVNPQRILRSWG